MKEIRLQGALVGLSPWTGRGSQWEVGRGEEAEWKRQPKQHAAKRMRIDDPPSIQLAFNPWYQRRTGSKTIGGRHGGPFHGLTQHFAFNDPREYLARLQALEATRVAQTAMREPQPLARPNCSDLVS